MGRRVKLHKDFQSTGRDMGGQEVAWSKYSVPPLMKPAGSSWPPPYHSVLTCSGFASDRIKSFAFCHLSLLLCLPPVGIQISES